MKGWQSVFFSLGDQNAGKSDNIPTLRGSIIPERLLINLGIYNILTTSYR